MRIISPKRLKEFWAEHPRAEGPLRVWMNVAKAADWQHFADLRRDFGSADVVGKHVVFNIGGNKFRLVAEVVYRWRAILVRRIMTHEQYDKDDWKE